MDSVRRELSGLRGTSPERRRTRLRVVTTVFLEMRVNLRPIRRDTWSSWLSMGEKTHTNKKRSWTRVKQWMLSRLIPMKSRLKRTTSDIKVTMFTTRPLGTVSYRSLLEFQESEEMSTTSSKMSESSNQMFDLSCLSSWIQAIMRPTRVHLTAACCSTARSYQLPRAKSHHDQRRSPRTIRPRNSTH